MYEVDTDLRVKKLKELTQADVGSADWDEYNPGETNQKSPPVEYEVKGKLLSPIVTGRSLQIERYERNGVDKYGFFQTSIIKSVSNQNEHLLVRTQNSIYKVERTEISGGDN